MLCSARTTEATGQTVRVQVAGAWYAFIGPGKPRRPGGVRKGDVTVPAHLFHDDPVAVALRRIEAFVPAAARGYGRNALHDGDGKPIPYALGLMGARREVRVVAAQGGEGRGGAPQDELERAREIAGLLSGARTTAAGAGSTRVERCQFTHWLQRVAPPGGGKAPAPLVDHYKRIDAQGADGPLLVRLVEWHGGEPDVRVKPNRDAPRLDVEALRGFRPEPEAGDQLEIVLGFSTSNGGSTATVFVHPDGSYAVVARAGAYDGADDAALKALLGTVGGIARRLGLRAPDPERDLEGATFHAEVRTAQRQPDFGALREAVEHRFYPLFAFGANKGAAHLRYKRVAGFDDVANVQEWLTEEAPHATPTSLAAALRRTFLSLGVTEAEELAGAAIERARQPDAARRRRRRRKFAVVAQREAVEVTVVPAREFFGFRVVAHGVQSMAQWRQLMADARAVVDHACGHREQPKRTNFDGDGDEKPPTKEAADVEDADVERGDIIKRLYEADRKLFQLHGKQNIYARHCGRHELRQPVVMKASKKAAAGVSAVAYGSTPDKAAENAYGCPAIWCPQSGVALTPLPHPLFDRQGRRRAGVPAERVRAIERKYQAQYVCPNAKHGGERPLFLYSSAYWGFNPQQERHIGFHSTKKNASGMCLPCCFKLPKARAVAECTGKPAADGNDEETNDKYVLSDAVPIKAGRYGALPTAFRSLLPDDAFMAKGFAARGRYVLREGVGEHSPSSLMAAVAALAGMPTVHAFVTDVQARLDPIALLQLENGQLLLRLLAIAPTRSKDDDPTSAGARRWLGDFAGPDRRAALWRARRALVTYLSGASVDVRLLFDLVARLHGFAIGMFEVDGDRLWFDCPAFVDYGGGSARRFGLVLRQGAFCEPLVVANVHRSAAKITAQRLVRRNDPVVGALLGHLVSTCQVPAADAAAGTEAGVHDDVSVAVALPPVEAIVMRRDLLLVGLLVAGGLLVPIHPPLPTGHLARLLAAHRNARLAHLEDLDVLTGPPDLVAALRSAAPNVQPKTRGTSAVTACGGAWVFDVLDREGRYRARCTLPVGPGFYAVPAEDDRTRWVAAQRLAEDAYQSWKHNVVNSKKQTQNQTQSPVTLRKLVGLAPRGVGPAWATRLQYELLTGIDVGPSAESSTHPSDGYDVSQRDLDTLRFSSSLSMGESKTATASIK